MNGFWLNSADCWDLLVWWTSYSLYLVWSMFNGNNQTSATRGMRTGVGGGGGGGGGGWKNSVDLHSDIYRPISFTSALLIEITKLYSLVSDSMTLTYSCMKKQRRLHSFSRRFLNWFGWDLICCVTCLFKVMLTNFTINVQGRNSTPVI